MNERRRFHRFNKNKNRAQKSDQPRNFGILPPPGILESYEEIAPGSVQKIMDMVKSEQEHRHKWENSYLRSMNFSHKLGQLLIFVLAVILIYATVGFVMSHSIMVAIIMDISGFAFLAILVVANVRLKRQFSHYRRHEDHRGR